MHPDELYQTRNEDWARLTDLLDRSQRDLKRLSYSEVQDLGSLYRSATSDLALAQRDFPRHQVTAYLNQLVTRAHAVVYHGEPLAYGRLVHFVLAGFPRAYRATLPFIVTAALMFLLPALAAGAAAAWRPEAARWILPAQVQSLIPSIERQELWTGIPVDERPYASAFIMQNNIQVSFLAFGSGVLAGVLTLYVLAFNGLILGGLTGLTAYHGVGFELWTFVIGHGVIELSVIFISGGAGLRLGWAVLHPGLQRRQDALALAARQVIKLVIGCVPLLVIAGAIEGFLSPAEGLPWQVKWGVGLGSGVLLYAYLLLGGRQVRPQN